ncbi:cytochrome-c peroxidase [Vibrio tapetis]|uniref:Putative cytochrome-c peroxidase n=1 Tax=Vibrio tapetis subsp. tapetis TaxID=1671868 RepID=A0A2N8ZLQ9_9VIBR|nr:cytochrome c peroxidase [Vibrio tapetis]SON52835.1 putative cytochrome-c peroxidase [Vibrio tapetis subsp. tapetis]
MNIKAINLSAIAAMVVTLTALPACAKQEDKNVEINAKEVAEALAPIELNGVFYPALAPLGDVPTPADNPTTPEKVALGKQLFFDGRLGGDTSTPCSACHNPALGWDFPADLSLGYPGTVHWRNSQTIINSAYYQKLFWAGSSKSLEGQAKSAAKGGVAGNGEDDLMEARLALVPEYVEQFNSIFGDNYPKVSNAWKAIAAFERTLVQKDTPLDKYLLGDKTALTEQQLKGKTLFEGKANCIACHNGALASDQKNYNVGVPTNLRWENDPLAQITFRYELYAKGSNEKMYRATKADLGVYFRGKRKEMKGKFRTPSIRYTKYTAPYMHNGTIATLADVVDFYDRGGVAKDGRTTGFPQTKSPMVKPLGLTADEKANLLAFLDAFTGEKMMMDYPKIPEYQRLFSEEELAEVKK